MLCSIRRIGVATEVFLSISVVATFSGGNAHKPTAASTELCFVEICVSQ